MELQAAEHKIGEFSLDLIGRDVASDEVVIIENQFGPTDHRHLGQLLTYAGGTDPTTVVWIAESFRERHRAALEWLNQHTDGSSRFFGVQLKIVTLAGAAPGLVAPLLEVVAQPNDWATAIQSGGTGASGTRDKQYFEFWSRWLERVKPRAWTNRRAPTKAKLWLPSGDRSVLYGVSFTKDGLLSELYFRGLHPEIDLERLDFLRGKRPLMEPLMKHPFDFDDLPNNKACRIAVARTGGESIDDDHSFEDYLKWFEDTQVELRAAVQAAGGIPPPPASESDGDPIDGDLAAREPEHH